MVLSKKAMQRKREKKQKTRKIKKGSLAGLSVIPSYVDWPVHECWVQKDLWEKGLGHVVVTRTNFMGEIAIGDFLLDVFCLGVKDCFVRLTHGVEHYQSMLTYIRETCFDLECVESSYAATLVHQAVVYAKQFGFDPHRDFAQAKQVLRNIPIDRGQTFSFGRNGEPCYIQGPYESPDDVKRILNTLEARAGVENYHSLVGVPAPAHYIFS